MRGFSRQCISFKEADCTNISIGGKVSSKILINIVFMEVNWRNIMKFVMNSFSKIILSYICFSVHRKSNRTEQNRITFNKTNKNTQNNSTLRSKTK